VALATAVEAWAFRPTKKAAENNGFSRGDQDDATYQGTALGVQPVAKRRDFDSPARQCWVLARQATESRSDGTATDP